MKRTLLFLVITLSMNTYAQELSKAEKKTLKKELKSLLKNPEEFKELKESSESKNLMINEQNNTINALRQESATKNATIKSLNQELNLLADSKKAKNKQCVINNDGYKYRVQIGLYQNNDLTYLLNTPKFIVHENINGLHRYSVGNFITEDEAEEFKLEMRRLGISDAFVTEYQDGMRDINFTSSNPKTHSNPVPQKVMKVQQTGFNNPGSYTSPKLNVVNIQQNNIDQHNEDNLEKNISTATKANENKSSVVKMNGVIPIKKNKEEVLKKNNKNLPSKVQIGGVK